MNQNLSPSLLLEFRKYLLDTFGLNFMEKRDSDLYRNIELAANEFSYSNQVEFINWVLKNNLFGPQKALFASFFTIGETYFLREKKSFDFLEQIYLPGLIYKRKENRKLRIWSAGCATGEEAYTLAILLKRVIPDIKNWDITILATDINPIFLEKAKRGVYTKWSFRNNPEWFIKHYFKSTGNNEFQILPDIKKMVTFSELNLAENIYPSEKNNTHLMDFIFCRNVLIYFNKKGFSDLTSRFYKSLEIGGLLFVSPVEMSSWIWPEFDKIFYSGYTIYQKSSEKGSKTIIQAEKPSLLNREKIVTAQRSTKNKTTSIHSSKPEAGKVPEKPKKQVLKPVISDFEAARKLFEQQEFEKAETLLSAVKTLNNKNLAIEIQLLAKTKANLGKLDEALSLCEEVLRNDKTNENYHYLKATILQELGQDEEALIALKSAIYLNPDFVLAHFLSGNICLKLGNKIIGRKHFKNALTILSKMGKDEILPESDGITVERFTQLINAIKN